MPKGIGVRLPSWANIKNEILVKISDFFYVFFYSLFK